MIGNSVYHFTNFHSCEVISESWRIVESRSASSIPTACFGLFVFRRVLSKIPMLCPLFSLSESDDIFNLPESHPVRRHARLFTNILHISVKNVDELEAQVAPTVFKYGERHYRPDIVSFDWKMSFFNSSFPDSSHDRRKCSHILCSNRLYSFRFSP